MSKKYLIVSTDKNREIIINTDISRFPHLVGMNYFPKYKSLTSQSFLSDIINGTLNDLHIMKLDKQDKLLVLTKIKAFDYISSNKIKGAKIHTSGSKVQFGDKLIGNGFILLETMGGKYIVVVLKKDSIGMFQMISVLLVSETSKKFKTINSYYTETIISYKTDHKVSKGYQLKMK